MGRWTAPDGAAVEFTKDGAFTVATEAGKPPAAKGDFLFVGNGVVLTFDTGGEVRWTACELTADGVTLTNAAGQVLEYKRARGSSPPAAALARAARRGYDRAAVYMGDARHAPALFVPLRPK